MASEQERKLMGLFAGLGAVATCLSMVLFIVMIEKEAEPEEPSFQLAGPERESFQRSRKGLGV